MVCVEGKEEVRVPVDGCSAKARLRAIGIIRVLNIFCFHSLKFTRHFLQCSPSCNPGGWPVWVDPQAPLLSSFLLGLTSGQHQQETGAEWGQCKYHLWNSFLWNSVVLAQSFMNKPVIKLVLTYQFICSIGVLLEPWPIQWFSVFRWTSPPFFIFMTFKKLHPGRLGGSAG